jgi:cyclopropane fatty-acyl-phospholipid synthase-like methyltransferase
MNKTELWEDFYEFDSNRSYEERALAHGRLDMAFAQVLKCAQTIKTKPWRYIDIGLTDGYMLRLAHKQGGFLAHGLDISSHCVQRLTEAFQKNNIKAELKCGSITAIPFSPGRFDIVSACEVIEHLQGENLARAFSELRRVLADKGFLVATTPFKEDVESARIKCPHCSAVFHPGGHLHSFDEDIWRKLLLQNKFQPVVIKRIYATDFRLNMFGWAMPIVRLAAQAFQVNSLTKMLVVAQKM